MVASRRGRAWCRICRPRVRRSRLLIPAFYPATCAWRSRVMQERDEIAKSSGVAESRSASSLSGRAFSSEVDTGSHVENASKRKTSRRHWKVCRVALGRFMPSVATKYRGQIAARYPHSRADELCAALVGQPRHELDHAPSGGGDHACGNHLYLVVRAVGLLRPRCHDIGGATNCANPARLANCPNQRSRFGSAGLLTPSTPNQRRA
jgi:hypothetical protein